MERLDKWISSCGMLSRKEAQKQIRSGVVIVNGMMCCQPDCKINPTRDVVTVSGQALCMEEHLYIMLNKPAGVVSATKDKQDKTVLDLLPREWMRPGLFPAGRLDKDTEGLLIITDDGAFAHRILSPKKHVEKRYIAQLDGIITPEMVSAFENGIVFRDGTQCLPAKLEVLSGSNGLSGLVVICEGKYHQIKKMFLAVGRKVMHLQRISIGGLYLDSNLPIGSAKKLTKFDIDAICMDNMYEN